MAKQSRWKAQAVEHGLCVVGHGFQGLESSGEIRALDSLVVTRFNTRFMKQSITYRGSVLWNRMTARHHSIVSAGSKDLEQKLILEIMTFYIIDYHFIRFSYR